MVRHIEIERDIILYREFKGFLCLYCESFCKMSVTAIILSKIHSVVAGPSILIVAIIVFSGIAERFADQLSGCSDTESKVV